MTSTTQRDTNFAVLVIVFTVLALSIGDALIKDTSADLVIWQIFVLRSLLAVLLLFVVLRVMKTSPNPMAIGWTLIRSMMLVAMWIAYYAALPHLPLSAAAATYYTLPIFITLLSALFTGEVIKPLGWLAVVIAFTGMLLLVKPGTGDFNLYALLPLASAVLYAGAMILTSTKCRGEHPLVLSLALNLTFIAVGLLITLVGMTTTVGDHFGFLAPIWGSLDVEAMGMIAVMGAAILIGSIGAAIAYQMGPPSVVGTFDFAYVGFAAIWGFVFFGEVPDSFSIIGILLIAGGGILAIRQSRA